MSKYELVEFNVGRERSISEHDTLTEAIGIGMETYARGFCIYGPDGNILIDYSSGYITHKDYIYRKNAKAILFEEGLGEL